MTDKRTLRSNGHVPAAELKGQVEPETGTIAAVVCDLCAEPAGPRDRQLIRGDVFMILEARDPWLFGYAQKDGYCGWVAAADLAATAPIASTHKVTAIRSYAKTTPGLKTMGQITPLPFGARLAVLGETDGWSRIAWSHGTASGELFVPSGHLSPLDTVATDPVDIASLFVGTPYLWGGNSAFGIDCSGLVQAGCLACAIPCPGDSDMQQGELGHELPPDVPLQRGDLLFWEGHVAWVAGPDRLIHANAFHMATAYEPLQTAVKRIDAQGGGPVTARKRLGEFT